MEKIKVENSNKFFKNLNELKKHSEHSERIIYEYNQNDNCWYILYV